MGSFLPPPPFMGAFLLSPPLWVHFCHPPFMGAFLPSPHLSCFLLLLSQGWEIATYLKCLNSPKILIKPCNMSLLQLSHQLPGSVCVIRHSISGQKAFVCCSFKDLGLHASLELLWFMKE